MVGDREEDMRAGKSVNAKTVFMEWGHGSLSDESLADVRAKSAEEFLTFAKDL